MPRITEQRRNSQRLAITIAARTCFARRGFHATTMDQIIAEAGMAPNTVYRYFASKDALIEAVCLEKTTEVADRINAMATTAPDRPLPAPGEVLTANVRSFAHPTTTATGRDSDQAQIAYLAINIWAQLYSDPDLRAKAAPTLNGTRQAITRIAQLWSEHHMLKPGITVDLAARTVWRTALGVITDQVVTDASLNTAAEDLDQLLLAH